MHKICFLFVATAIVAATVFQADSAQRLRRARTRQSPEASQRAPGTIPTPSPEEDAELIKECSTPDRPQPDVVTASRGNALLSGKAISKPVPPYPTEAKEAGVAGTVAVRVAVDEYGRVFWAAVVSGDPLLHEAAKWAACRARWTPITMSGRAVRVSGAVTYNFVLR